MEEVAYVEIDEIASIEGLDDDIAGELQNRATEALERREGASREERRALGVEDALAELPHLNEAMLVTLGKAKILTLDDLADLATDELVQKKRAEPRRRAEGTSQRTEDKGGVLADYGLTEEQGNEIIMAARAHWFEDEATSLGRTLLRKPQNDTLGALPARPDAGPNARSRRERSSERTCVLSRRTAPRDELIRLALGPDGQVAPDVRARADGRGAWIGVGRAALEAAQAKGKLKGALARAFKTSDLAIPADLGERIEAALRQAALDRLGLEARGGTLLTGSRTDRASGARGQGPLADPRLRRGRGRQRQARPGVAGRRLAGARLLAGVGISRCPAPSCRWRSGAKMWYMSP